MTRKRVGLETPKTAMVNWEQVRAYCRSAPLQLESAGWRLVTEDHRAEVHLLDSAANALTQRQIWLEAGAALGYLIATLHLQGFAPEIAIVPPHRRQTVLAQIDVQDSPRLIESAQLLIEVSDRLQAVASANPVWMRVFGRDHEISGLGRHPEHLLVLYTDADTEVDWLTSGLAAARIVLSGEAVGVDVAVLESAFKNRNLRLQLHHKIGRTNYPQVVLQLGHPASPHRVKTAHKEHKANSISIDWMERTFSGVHHERA